MLGCRAAIMVWACYMLEVCLSCPFQGIFYPVDPVVLSEKQLPSNKTFHQTVDQRIDIFRGNVHFLTGLFGFLSQVSDLNVFEL